MQIKDLIEVHTRQVSNLSGNLNGCTRGLHSFNLSPREAVNKLESCVSFCIQCPFTEISGRSSFLDW